MSAAILLYTALWGVFGTILGSFANVLIYRIPRNKSIVFPASACGSCGTPIKWYDNIPIISYLILGGKCRHCGAPYSVRYLFVELLMGLLFAYSAYYFAGIPLAFIMTIFAAIFIFVLTVLFWIDLEHYILPDVITIPFLVLGLMIAIGIDLTMKTGYPFFVTSTFFGIVGALSGFVFFYLIALIGQLVYKKEAMGGGDIKLVAGLGMWLGWKILIVSLFISFALGVLMYLLLKNRFKDGLFPFGTALALSGIVSLFFGQSIINWYLNFLIH